MAKAAELGAQVLGQIGGPFNRAKLANGTTENRGGESTAGNLVAEVQKWATEAPGKGGAQIAFMNPGGIRTDLVGTGTGAFPRDLTYRQAAEMQPFANGLVNMRLTGAQIKAVLEQQWQRDDAGNVPSRPFLRLGTSKGFTSTYDPSRPEGDRITGMWLNGEPIASGTTYSVTANSFLAAGGDNFRGFRAGTQKSESGQSDLEAMVAYMAEFTGGSKPPLPVDYKQHQVGVKFPAGAPASYKAGDHVKFDLSSLAFSTAADLKDTEVTVSLGDDVLGTFPVDNTIGTAATDEYGTASVDVVLPAGTPGGSAELTVKGATTGTEVPVTVPTEKTDTTITAEADDMTYGTDGSVAVDVDPDAARGEVTVKKGDTVVATGTLGDEGKADIVVPGDSLPVGTNILTVEYAGNGAYNGSSTTVTIEVAAASPTVTAVATPSTVKVKKGTSKIAVTVAADGFTPEGFVAAYLDGEYLSAAPLTDGKATLTVGPFDTVGAKAIEIRYLATPTNEGASTTVTVTVQKATPKVKVKGPDDRQGGQEPRRRSRSPCPRTASCPPARWSSGSTASRSPPSPSPGGRRPSR